MSAMVNFQFHVIGRIDDTTQVLVNHSICVHDTFPNCLKTKLNWSKNVGDKHNSPWQIVLGSMDTTYCVLVSMAIWFELKLHANASAMLSPYLFLFCNNISIPTARWTEVKRHCPNHFWSKDIQDGGIFLWQ
jgi:hypothetical protein